MFGALYVTLNVALFVGLYFVFEWLSVRKSPQPYPGEVWRSTHGTGGDPWAKPEFEIEIVEVRDGWVRYRFVEFPGSTPSTKTVRDLRRFWRRITP